MRALAVTAGTLTGLVVEPDLDISGKTESEKLIERKFGKWIGIAWRAYWYPYAKTMAHRGFSHMPIISTLIRALYLLLPAIAGWALLGFPELPWIVIGYWLAGLCIADLGHIITDILSTHIKKLFRST
jgi:uncharacterized metal-binding protein